MAVDAAAVKVILDTDLGDPDIDAFITTATQLYDTTVALDAGAPAAALKDEIIKYLAAHFITATRERRAEKEAAGGGRYELEGKTAMGLDGTRYGQNAQALDPTGRLSSISEFKSSLVFKIGSGKDHD